MASLLNRVGSFFLTISFLSFVALVVLFFINGWWALYAFVIGVLSSVLCYILYALYSSTPEGKREIAKAAELRKKKEAEAAELRKREEAKAAELRKKEEAEAKRAKRIEAAERQRLEKNVKVLSGNPIDIEALQDILDTLEALEPDKLEPLIGNVILPLLEIKPLDERVRATVFTCAKRMTASSVQSSNVPSQLFYDVALDILQQHPDQLSLKKYALEIGRWHHSSVRPDRTVTIYDEQAMQNDIMVRLK